MHYIFFSLYSAGRCKCYVGFWMWSWFILSMFPISVWRQHSGKSELMRFILPNLNLTATYGKMLISKWESTEKLKEFSYVRVQGINGFVEQLLGLELLLSKGKAWTRYVCRFLAKVFHETVGYSWTYFLVCCFERRFWSWLYLRHKLYCFHKISAILVYSKITLCYR
jgi:hypothetical protein